jgi:drug/metabolite transporter (DMT)-like permease
MASIDAPAPLNARAVGLTMAAMTTVIAAVQPVLMRYGAQHLDPLLYAAGCGIVAALCVLPVLHLRGELRPLFDPRYRVRLFGVSAAGTVVTTLTLVFGLRHIDAIPGTLLLQSEPVYSLLLATIFVGERPSLRQIAATAVVLCGIASVLGAGGAYSPAWAALLVGVTPLFWQTAHILSLPVMPPLSPVCITGARYGYAAVVLAVLMAVFNPSSLAQLRDPAAIITIVATGAVVYFLGSLTWYAAINRLSLTWTTALVIPGVPLLSTVFAIIFLGERASAREIIGILIAIGGVLTLVLGADGIRRAPAPDQAEALHYPIS